MTRDERILFAELSALNPGEFRRLMKIGHRTKACKLSLVPPG